MKGNKGLNALQHFRTASLLAVRPGNLILVEKQAGWPVIVTVRQKMAGGKTESEVGAEMALGGLDIGTSGCKCTIMNTEGKLLSSCYQDYAVSRTASAHEVDARVIWEAVCTVIRGAIAKSSETMTALSVTSFGESCALLDNEGRELGPILLYTDPRGQEQCDELIEKIPEKEIYRICGHRPNPTYFLPKLMWIRENQPELYEKIRFVLPVNAYIVYRLTGEAVADYSLAARTMMLDIRARDWSDKLLQAAGVDRRILPRVIETGTAAGKVLSSTAKELGMSPDALVVIGCHDQVAASLGAGAMKAGTAVNGSGTVECVTPVFDSIPEHPVLFDSGYAIVPAIRNLYVTYAYILTGGALLQWYRDQFAATAYAQAKASGKSIYAVLDSMVKPEPTGLLLLPHFAGAATPYMDIHAKGAICGLSLENDAADVYQAMLEGICYEMRMNLELLEQAGIVIDGLRATGGGARSPVWLQIKADILDKPIDTLNVDEAGTVGSLMLAGLATGDYANLDEAFELVHTVKRLTPAENRERYTPIYNRYRRVYNAMRTIYAD